MATYILEKIKIQNELEDLLSKTSGDNVSVVYDGKQTTLTSALASILTEIKNLPTSSGIDSKIDTKISAAIDTLIGGAPETYDTLKEIADYIASDTTATGALTSAIGNKVDKEEGKGISSNDFTDALLAKLNSLENTVVDDALSTTSKNPVQNKVINAALAGKSPTTHTHSAATKSVAGFMSAADKTRLDDIRGVRYGKSAPSDMEDGELFIRVVN